MRSDLASRRGSRATGGVSRERRVDRFGMASEDEARRLLARSGGHDTGEGLVNAVPLVQGGYYLLTGLWPLAHMGSFEMVTGRKRDRWLVRTVGTLVASIGIGLLRAGRRGYVPRDLRIVSRLAAAGLLAVEAPTALRGRISPVYLADAALELSFIGASLWAERNSRDTGRELEILARREARTIDRTASA